MASLVVCQSRLGEGDKDNNKNRWTSVTLERDCNNMTIWVLCWSTQSIALIGTDEVARQFQWWWWFHLAKIGNVYCKLRESLYFLHPFRVLLV